MLHAIEKHQPADGENYTPAQIQAMQRTVVNIFERWGIRDSDAAILLGGVSTKTFKRWKDGDYGRVGRDQADRLSNILGIHKSLRLVFREATRGY